MEIITVIFLRLLRGLNDIIVGLNECLLWLHTGLLALRLLCCHSRTRSLTSSFRLTIAIHTFFLSSGCFPGLLKSLIPKVALSKLNQHLSKQCLRTSCTGITWRITWLYVNLIDRIWNWQVCIITNSR